MPESSFSWASRRQASKRGLALVLVLWIVTLLAIIAASFSLNIRREAGIVHNIMEISQARLAAEAGVVHTMLMLAHPVLQERWQVQPKPYQLEFEQAHLSILIRDSRAFVDLNYAPDALLEGLLQSVMPELDHASVEAISAHIIAWRSAKQPESKGAQRVDYQAQGLDYGPRYGAFPRVEELQRVYAVTPDIYRALHPFVTVEAQSARIHPFSASPEVLQALPGIGENDVAAYVNARLALLETTAGLEYLAPSASWLATGDPTHYTVDITARLASGIQTTLRVGFPRESIASSAEFGTLSRYETLITY